MFHALVLAAASACSTPDTSAAATQTAAPKVSNAMLLDHPTQTLVEITVGADGKLSDARVYTTSGDPQLDAAALATVHASSFAPAIVSCKPTTQTALFRVDFAARTDATAAPTPDPCNRPASVVHAVSPEFPTALRDQFKSSDPVLVKLAVDIATDGSVRAVHLLDTSGNPQIDLLGINAARASTYAPALAACKPVAGTFTYTIDFRIGE